MNTFPVLKMIQIAQPQLKREVSSPKTFMSFNICCQFVLRMNIFFFLTKIYHLESTLTLILWKNLPALMSSPLASAGFEPPAT